MSLCVFCNEDNDNDNDNNAVDLIHYDERNPIRGICEYENSDYYYCDCGSDCSDIESEEKIKINKFNKFIIHTENVAVFLLLAELYISVFVGVILMSFVVLSTTRVLVGII